MSQPLKLPLGVKYLLVNTCGLGQRNSATINYHQIGSTSLRTRLLIELLLEMSWHSRPHDRTNENLLYCDILWELSDDCGILGYNIRVNTTEDSISAVYVDICIDELRNELEAVIERLSDEQFQIHISGIIANRIPNDGALKHEADRNWLEILDGEYLFDRYLRENEILAAISRSELLAFYRDSSGSNERKLSVQFIGCG